MKRLCYFTFCLGIFISCLSWGSCFANEFEEMLETMTLEEKIGQLLMVHFHGEIANTEAKALIQEMHIGGFIYYNWSNGLSTKSQVMALSKSLQEIARRSSQGIPLLIAVDQEGGRIVRLTEGFTVFPGNRALGKTKRPELSREMANIIGEELLDVGVNMNLSPVVDIDSNPDNPVIGSRSFGDNPDIVIAFGKEALIGYREAGIISTLKHFPGHGDTKQDSHKALPVIDKSLEQLEKLELLPFKELKEDADAIMTAHLLVPAFDNEYCATLSKKTLDYLKNVMGFKGVIITDSLVMEGALKQCSSIEEAAILAFNAGNDILLLGGKQLLETHDVELTIQDIKRIYLSLINAVRSGRISEDRVDESVIKILKLKFKKCTKSGLPQSYYVRFLFTKAAGC